MNRRHFLAQSGMLAAGGTLASPALFGAPSPAPPPKGNAEHIIFFWLGGGMAQIDTFDPKRKGDAKTGKPGSEYDRIDTSVPDVQFCEHLPRSARLAEEMTVVRTVHHNSINEHASATNLVHTGRKTTGSITYPSIGSIVAHQRGAANPDVPAYMLIGYPNVSRGPGFLGSQGNFVYLTDTGSGPSGFTRPSGVTNERVDRRVRLLEPTIADQVPAEGALTDYVEAQQDALRLAGPQFMRHFRLEEEPDDLRNDYGGEFGQRCLMSRRLVEAGVRFIEVSHNLNFINGTGWDTHNEGQLKQHLLIRELDIALSALIRDLKQKHLLDKTLIVIGTEFGRPAGYDKRGGRGHQASCFSLVLAGGGLNHCGAYGVTDELSEKIVQAPVPLADFHATVHAAIGIDPSHELTDGSRPVPITDGGRPIPQLFS